MNIFSLSLSFQAGKKHCRLVAAWYKKQKENEGKSIFFSSEHFCPTLSFAFAGFVYEWPGLSPTWPAVTANVFYSKGGTWL